MKNIVYYPAIFRKEDVGFSVEFIDVPGAITQGDDLKEAFDMAKDVLYLIILDYINDLPKPTMDFNSIELNEGDFISIIELDIEQYGRENSNKTVSTTVTMPEYLKEIAENIGINYSQLLQRSIKKELQKSIDLSNIR